MKFHTNSEISMTEAVKWINKNNIANFVFQFVHIIPGHVQVVLKTKNYEDYIELCKKLNVSPKSFIDYESLDHTGV